MKRLWGQNPNLYELDHRPWRGYDSCFVTSLWSSLHLLKLSLKASQLPRHPHYELGSSSLTSCSIARWNSVNAMHCKLISFKSRKLKRGREPFIYPKLQYFSCISIWIFQIVLLWDFYRHKQLLTYRRFSHELAEQE